MSSKRWSLRPTGAGSRFLLLILVMGFAAYNTRNNLLYLMFSVGLATVAVSVVAGWLSIRWMVIETGEPSDLYAGARSTERFRLWNKSRWLDGYGIEIEELDSPAQSARSSLPHLGRRQASVLAIGKVYPRRGVYKSERMRITTSFPFGLFRTARRFRLAREITVFPRVERVDISFLFEERSGLVPVRQRGGESEELLRIRDYAVGDGFHHIHWKATAKLGKMMVRDFASGEQRSFSIILDNSALAGEIGRVEEERFERSICAAASLASHLSSHALPFRFITGGEAFPHGVTPRHLRGVLTHLAVLETTTEPRMDLTYWTKQSVRDGDVVVVFASQRIEPWASLASPRLHIIEPATLLPQRGPDRA